MQNFIAQLIINSAIMSTISVVLIVLTPLLKRRYTAESIYYAWIIIVAGFIIPFRPYMGFGWLTEKVTVTLPYQNLFQEISSDTGSITERFINPNTSDNYLSMVILGIWVVGMIAAGSYFVFRHYRFIKIVNRWSRDITDQEFLSAFKRIKDEMKIKGNLEVRVCPVVSGPMLTGMRKPVIILPDVNILPEAMPFILKHELVHFKRRDLIVKWVALMAVTINWFNPVIYSVYRHLSLQMELTCDKSVVGSGEKKFCKEYSEAILHIIGHQTKSEGILSTNFLGGNHFLQVRLLDIMNVTKKKFGVFILSVALIVTMMSGIVAADATDDQPSYDGISDLKNTISNICEETCKIEGDTIYYFRVFKSLKDAKNIGDKEFLVNCNGVSGYVTFESFYMGEKTNKIVAKYVGKLNIQNKEDTK